MIDPCCSPFTRPFGALADIIVYGLLKLPAENRWTDSLHFFILDVTKILVLLTIMIYVIALLRANLNTNRVRTFLSGKNRFFGYLTGSAFGAVTPFCSCSSIPLFIGFTSARIPLGITMSFLITSPLINEVALVLLGSLLGWKFMLVYIVTGVLAGVIGGFFLDSIKAERFLQDWISEQPEKEIADDEKKKLTLKDRHHFAWNELKSIFGRVWKWVLIGVGLGAIIHGFVPEDFIARFLGKGQWWTVPGAVLIGIPLYSSASGVIPVAHSLLEKGLPVGTAIAFMMSTVAASFPEFILLKQVMKPKLLLIFFAMLLVFFTLAGWLFNLVF